MEKSDKRVIAFDLGNVLFGFDYVIALQKIEKRMRTTVNEVMEALYAEDFTIPFEKGLVSGPAFYENFKKEFALTCGYTEFVDIWCKIFFPKNEVINLARKVSYHYPLYLISNTNELHFEYLYNKYKKFFLLFDSLILSYRVKSVKPENEIYQALKDATKRDYKDIVYIEDRKELIMEAKRLNFQCIHFIDYLKLCEDLKRLKVNIT
jgi:putative hydrolase of the HAD superfamily